MTKLGLTLNEAKTSLRNARQERFDFLGYSFGVHWFETNGKWYLGASPECTAAQDKGRRASGAEQYRSMARNTRQAGCPALSLERVSSRALLAAASRARPHLTSKFGRKPKLSDYQRAEAIKRRAAGATLAEIAKSYAVDISMISRLAPGFRSPFEASAA
jgi:hypothetical protein